MAFSARAATKDVARSQAPPGLHATALRLDSTAHHDVVEQSMRMQREAEEREAGLSGPTLQASGPDSHVFTPLYPGWEPDSEHPMRLRLRVVEGACPCRPPNGRRARGSEKQGHQVGCRSIWWRADPLRSDRHGNESRESTGRSTERR